MLTARLIENNDWILVEGDALELRQLKLCFTKKIPNWFIIKSKNPNAVVEEKFMNNIGLIPVGLWIELINSCKHFGYQLAFLDGFNEKIKTSNISFETFTEYINGLFQNSKMTPRDYQMEGVYRMIEYKRCCVEVSTSGGKTLMAYMLFRFMKDFLHFNHIVAEECVSQPCDAVDGNYSHHTRLPDRTLHRFLWLCLCKDNHEGSRCNHHNLNDNVHAKRYGCLHSVFHGWEGWSNVVSDDLEHGECDDKEQCT